MSNTSKGIGQDRLVGIFGSKYLPVATYNNQRAYAFIVQEDSTSISALSGGDESMPQVINTGSVRAAALTTAISSGTTGQYNNVAYTGGTGTGLVLNITVTGATTGVVTVINAGTGYVIGDVITVTAAELGAGSGGPVITLAYQDFGIDYLTAQSLGSVTLSKGALIAAPQGETFKTIIVATGSIIAYS
jgi:hypothetical protein|tara:strand:- start:42 stop:608 length:567 start_codon:yes stop_codon:yes gene_type:complete